MKDRTKKTTLEEDRRLNKVKNAKKEKKRKDASDVAQISFSSRIHYGGQRKRTGNITQNK